jgi:NADPH2:quinone reductase
MMRAVVISEPGGPEVLEVIEVPDPIPGPDEILVAVHHSAINRADLLQRMGAYPDPVRRTHNIPGLEYAGVVAAVGERVSTWQVGDAVMGIESGACQAELLTTHERQAMPVPDGVALADAAAIPEVFLTAWDALVVQGGLTSGRWALVHAGASGVGTAAIQICGAIGARIVVTCSAGKMEACSDLGADLVLERSPNDWAATLGAELPDGVDVVLDVVGGDEINRNLQVVRTGASVVQVGLMGGGTTEVNVAMLMARRLRWIGTTLRARPLEEKIAISQRFISEVLPLFDSGDLHPVIDRRYGLAEIADAHRHMGSNANVGKILLDLRP